MKKNVYNIFVAALALVAFSCSEKGLEPQNPQEPGIFESTIAGLYVLNSGKEESNNSTLAYWEASSGVLASDVFMGANGKKLGDTANDMVIHGDRMYIAVTGSSVVFVSDLKGNIIKEITVVGEGGNLSPRDLAVGGSKVYVSFMEGYLGEIDTASYNVRKIKVGPMPEGVAYANRKVYVANSDGYNVEGGYGKTVSVVDAMDFAVIKTLDVAMNPQTLHVASDNSIYLVALGNYMDIPASLQKINTTTDTVTDIPGVEPTNMAIGKGGIAYILSAEYDENWNATSRFYIFDTTKDKIMGELISPEQVPHGYSIFTDKATEYIYIGTSDYISNGDVYVVSKEGQIKLKFDTGGLNPIAVCTVKK